MKIAVAMSGGVDSSIAAVLLKEMGHDIIGITAEISENPTSCRDDVCFSSRSIEDARSVADKLNFLHYTHPVEDSFTRIIIDPFCNEYLKGRTPNPCIHCNPKIKFKSLIKKAQELGCSKLATGHYANINKSPEGRYYISMGSDPDRDQSYFLFMLPQVILRKIIFPLGVYGKKEIRRIAKDYGLSVSEKEDSQEICFVPDNNYPKYIEQKTGIIPPPGNIIDMSGNIIGSHKGIHRYTIGQRRGLGISAPKPLYVIKIDAVNNTIIAGLKEDLKTKGLIAKDIKYMYSTSLDKRDVLVKMRSTQTPVKAFLEEVDKKIIVHFNELQIGVTPGQASVFYDEDKNLLGGGIIEKRL